MANVIALDYHMVDAIQRASEKSKDGSVLIEKFPEQVLISWDDGSGVKMNTGFPHSETAASKLHEDA